MAFLDALARSPWLFHHLRKIPEANYRQTRRRIRARLDPRARTLDLGCGSGEFCRCFERDSYVGVDLSVPYAAFARRRYPDRAFAAASGKALPLLPGSFSQVLVNGVLHHLPDETARLLLAEARRVLRAQGRLLLIEDIEPASAGILSRWMHRADRGGHIRPPAAYEALLAPLFAVTAFETYISGICPYALWEAKASP